MMDKLNENSDKPEETIPRYIVFRRAGYTAYTRCHLVIMKEKNGWMAHYISGDESIMNYHGETLNSSMRNAIRGLNSISKKIRDSST